MGHRDMRETGSEMGTSERMRGEEMEDREMRETGMSETGMSEREMIRRITEVLGGVENDDCAVIDAGDRYLVATTDMLHRKSDFPVAMTPWQIGWMTAAVNLSDIAAMGAVPSGLIVAAGLQPKSSIDIIDGIFSGLRDCTEAFGTRVLGGDLDSTDELNLTASAFGFVEKDLILRRSGARPGDLLCTTGSLGGAGAGLLALQRGETEGDDIGDVDTWDVDAWDADTGNSLVRSLVRSLLEPQPRMREGRMLALSRSVTAMMDNSDGLALSLYDLSVVSGVGFSVLEESIPIAPGIEETVGREKAMDLVLRAGGDFELIFTVSPDCLDKAMRAVDQADNKLTVIGTVVEDGIWMEKDGMKTEIKPEGYEHRMVISSP